MKSKMHAEIITPGPPNRLRLTLCKRMVEADQITAFLEHATCQACLKQLRLDARNVERHWEALKTP